MPSRTTGWMSQIVVLLWPRKCALPPRIVIVINDHCGSSANGLIRASSARGCVVGAAGPGGGGVFVSFRVVTFVVVG